MFAEDAIRWLLTIFPAKTIDTSDGLGYKVEPLQHQLLTRRYLFFSEGFHGPQVRTDSLFAIESQ